MKDDSTNEMLFRLIRQENEHWHQARDDFDRELPILREIGADSERLKQHIRDIEYAEAT